VQVAACRHSSGGGRAQGVAGSGGRVGGRGN
jgi:hypothetical protein